MDTNDQIQDLDQEDQMSKTVPARAGIFLSYRILMIGLVALIVTGLTGYYVLNNSFKSKASGSKACANDSKCNAGRKAVDDVARPVEKAEENVNDLNDAPTVERNVKSTLDKQSQFMGGTYGGTGSSPRGLSDGLTKKALLASNLADKLKKIPCSSDSSLPLGIKSGKPCQGYQDLAKKVNEYSSKIEEDKKILDNINNLKKDLPQMLIRKPGSQGKIRVTSDNWGSFLRSQAALHSLSSKSASDHLNAAGDLQANAETLYITNPFSALVKAANAVTEAAAALKDADKVNSALDGTHDDVKAIDEKQDTLSKALDELGNNMTDTNRYDALEEIISNGIDTLQTQLSSVPVTTPTKSPKQNKSDSDPEYGGSYQYEGNPASGGGGGGGRGMYVE